MSRDFDNYPTNSRYYIRAKGYSVIYSWTVWCLQYHFTFSITGSGTYWPQFIRYIEWVSSFCFLAATKGWESALLSSFKVDNKDHSLYSDQICSRPGYQRVLDYMSYLGLPRRYTNTEAARGNFNWKLQLYIYIIHRGRSPYRPLAESFIWTKEFYTVLIRGNPIVSTESAIIIQIPW